MQGEAKGCIALMQNYSSVAAICRVKSAGSHLSCTKVTTLSLQVADFFFSSDYRWDLQGGIHAARSVHTHTRPESRLGTRVDRGRPHFGHGPQYITQADGHGGVGRHAGARATARPSTASETASETGAWTVETGRTATRRRNIHTRPTTTHGYKCTTVVVTEVLSPPVVASGHSFGPRLLVSHGVGYDVPQERIEKGSHVRAAAYGMLRAPALGAAVSPEVLLYAKTVRVSRAEAPSRSFGCTSGRGQAAGSGQPGRLLRKSKTRSRTTAGTETTPRAEAAEGKEQPAVAALGAGRPATGQTQWSLPKTSDCRNPHVCRLPRSGGEKFAAARRAAAYGSTSLSTRSSPAKSGLCATTCRGGLSPSPSSCYSLYTSLQMWSSSSSKSRIARP